MDAVRRVGDLDFSSSLASEGQSRSGAFDDPVVKRRGGSECGIGSHSVSFVLPAYNEELNIARALRETLTAGRRYCSRFEVIVVDDGSTDSTSELVEAEAARSPEVRLVCHEINRGYGEALRTGFRAAVCDFVFFTDADNQFDMNELGLLLGWAGEASVVAGFRKLRQDPVIRLLNAWAWNRLVRVLFCVPVRDIDCAFKLFRRSDLAAIDIESRGAMINTEIMVKLARAGCRIVEVGVTHYPRHGGAPQGAKLKVIMRAFREVLHLYPSLVTLAPPPVLLDQADHLVPNGHQPTQAIAI